MTERDQGRPLVGSLSDLEFRLGVRRADLRKLLESRSSMYCSFQRPKKQHPYPGKLRRLDLLKPIKYRRIDNPSRQLKDIQRRILRKILASVDLPAYMVGGVSGKTLFGHASEHVGTRASTLVRMDISSYYPSVTCHHVYFVWNVVLDCPPPVAKLLTELTTFEWHLPQGAPTSAALANIFLASIYAPVCLASKRAGLTITTWVDDLIFSGPSAREIMETVRSTLAAEGFKVAPGKRDILGPRAEKLVTGVRIGKVGPRAPHRKMSELRAAIHRLAVGSVDAAELGKYRQNLSARIAHLGTLHEGDAAKLKRYAAKSGVTLK
jgi:hypothetical protein